MIDNKGFAHILLSLVVSALIIIGAAILWANFRNDHFVSNENKSINQKEGKPYDTADSIYPDTDNPPNLIFYFGEESKQSIPDEDVLRIGQFGAFEGGGQPTPFKIGYEPNSEMEISLKAKQYPIYAFTKGIITYIQEGDSGEIAIRYGRKYALKHLHVSSLSEKLKVGQKIEAGDFIGLTPIIKAGPDDPRGHDSSFLEIEFDKVISDRAARAVNAFNYFDEPSKNALEKIRLADKEGVKPDWVGTTIDKSKSWIPYVGNAETWADMYKIGFEGDLESFEEFAKNNNLEWVLNK